MDFNEDIYTQPAPDPCRRSASMALASMILGMIAVFTSCCIYLALVCGALGIILALLSKGGSTRMDAQGKAGLALSSIGLVLTIMIYVTVFMLLLYQYGGIEGLMQEYRNLYQYGTKIY